MSFNSTNPRRKRGRPKVLEGARGGGFRLDDATDQALDGLVNSLGLTRAGVVRRLLRQAAGLPLGPLEASTRAPDGRTGRLEVRTDQ